MRCDLDKDINKCPYFENDKCKNKEVCSFQIVEDDTNSSYKYVRKERWYEKYYTRRSR